MPGYSVPPPACFRDFPQGRTVIPVPFPISEAWPQGLFLLSTWLPWALSSALGFHWRENYMLTDYFPPSPESTVVQGLCGTESHYQHQNVKIVI